MAILCHIWSRRFFQDSKPMILGNFPAIRFRWVVTQINQTFVWGGSTILTSWWLNQPNWTNMLVKLDHFPQVSDWTFKTCLSCHQLVYQANFPQSDVQTSSPSLEKHPQMKLHGLQWRGGPQIHRVGPKKLAISRGWNNSIYRPFRKSSDLELGNQKVTLNHNDEFLNDKIL